MKDKKVMITGGGSGLGKALAEIYVSQGYAVYLLGRNLDKLKASCQEITENGGEAYAFGCDVGDPTSVERWKGHVISHDLYFEICIQSAGVGHFGPLEALEEDAIENMVKVNLLGTVWMTQAMLPFASHFVNIISTAGLKGKKNESVYCATKFGVRGFTEAMRLEAPDKIFTAVYMGGMDTPFWVNSQHIQDKTRLKSPMEIARQIVEQNDGRANIEI